VLRDQPVRLVTADSRVDQELRVIPEIQDRSDWLEIVDRLDSREPQDLKDLRVHRDSRVMLDHRELLDPVDQ